MSLREPTERLVFREMTEGDLDPMTELLGDPEVMTFYDHPKDRSEALAWIQWNQRLYREHGFGLWLLELRETGEFVGDCGLTPQEVDGIVEIEVGYHVRRSLQRQGYATEAAIATRDFARGQPGPGASHRDHPSRQRRFPAGRRAHRAHAGEGDRPPQRAEADLRRSDLLAGRRSGRLAT